MIPFVSRSVGRPESGLEARDSQATSSLGCKIASGARRQQ